MLIFSYITGQMSAISMVYDILSYIDNKLPSYMFYFEYQLFIIV